MASEPINSQADLSRRLKFSSAFFVVISSMIGTGIFTTSGFIMDKLKDPWLLLTAWVFGGVLALCGALSYAELGAMFPHSGGDYVFLREAYGKVMAYLSGWISLLVGFSAPIAATAVAFEGYFLKTFPLLGKTFPSHTLSIGAIIVISMLHARGHQAGRRTQHLLSTFNLLLIGALLVFGFLSKKGTPLPPVHDFTPSHIFTKEFFVSWILVSFAYCGWNASAYIGGEIDNPGRNIPRSIILGTLLVTTLYVLLNLLFLYAVPMNQMQGVREIGELAAVTLFGPSAGGFFSIGICVVLLSCLSAMILTGPRIYYAMARDHSFVDIFARVNPRQGVPSVSIYLQMSIAILLVLTSTFYSLLIYIGFMLGIFSSLTVLGVLILRVRRPSLARPYRTWLFPLTPIAFLLANSLILASVVRDNPKVLFWGMVSVVVGLASYYFFKITKKS